MAGQCMLALVLTFFLSAGNILADVDQNWLTGIVEGIKNNYALGDTFSLAVNIPQNQDLDSLQEVLQGDPADTVKEVVSQGQVYQGTRVVAATQSEALARVLENVQPFIKSSEGNFLIIYSVESPCGATCAKTSEDDVASKIDMITQNWRGYAFVFSNVVDDPAADASQQAQSFKQLAVSKLGLGNIFRCYEPGGENFQCTSCSSGEDVTPSCVTNTNQAPVDTGKQLINKVEEFGKGIGRGIAAGIGEGTGKQIVERNPGEASKCKKPGPNGECELRRGGRRRGGRGKKSGKLRSGRKGKGRKKGKGKKRGKKNSRRGGKGKKGSKRGRGGKRRGGGKRRRGGNRRRGGRRKG